MKKLFVILIASLAIVVLTIYSGSLAATKADKGDLVVVSKEVSSAPTDASSPQWKEAEKARIVLTGAGAVEGNKNTIKVRSVYTKDEIFFLFQWHDYNKSMNKNAWKFTGGEWVKKKGDEDRLGMVFEIYRINKFATKGCTVFCHNEPKDQEKWYYAVDSPKEKADMWHWKAVRSNPVGYTEDGYVTTNPSKKPEEGRKRDEGSDTKAKSNRTKDKSKPAYMQDPSKPPSIEGSLLVKEAVPISDYSKFKEGDEIPGYMLYPDWQNSFADVKTIGVWENGTWTVMMRRKLNTGYDDDLQFNTRKTYPFGLAVFDNAHEHNSYNSEPLKLKFD
jgi:uncharacterized protein YbaA (DUF1428 family)